MAAKRKMPKRPKASAPLSTWKRYEEKCKEVRKHNENLLKEKKAKEAIINRTRK